MMRLWLAYHLHLMKSNQFSGVVYRYVNTTPGEECGYSYVGEAPDEEKRRSQWNRPKNDYAGPKIRDARVKYGLKAFTYEVLESVNADTEEELSAKLDKQERYWISVLNSYHAGYNGNLGGRGLNGVKLSQQTKTKMSASHKGKPHPLTEQGKEKWYASHCKAVLVTDRHGNVDEYSSVKDASEKTGYSANYYLKHGKTTRKEGFKFTYKQ